MTDQYTEDQEIELYDEVENEDEVVEEAHDPKNAEAQSVASVDAAGEKTGTAKKRKGDNTKQDPMPKSKAGMINAAYNHMAKMKKEDLSIALSKLMSEDYDIEEGEETEARAEIQYETDFSQDLNALISDEATLSEEFRGKAETIFEAAIKSKLSEEIDRLETKYEEELAEEIEATKSDLVEKVDGYLNYVVEQWMEDNKVAIQSGLRTEIAEEFMQGMKALFEDSYIDVPESKVDLVDELADTVEELEEQLNETTAKAIQMSEALEVFQKEAIVREMSGDLVATQVEKLNSLVEDIDFEDEDTFRQKVTTVKESYFKKETAPTQTVEEESDDDFSSDEIPAHMSKYISALKKTNTK
jgi:hypothetical protein